MSTSGRMFRRPAGTMHLVVCVLALLGLAGRSAPARAANPDFDAVRWTPLGCDASPVAPVDPGIRAELDLIGDDGHPTAYVARDATYLYFRYRVGGNPLDSMRGFHAADAWSMLVQVPSGDGSQYQYQLSLNGDRAGNNDTIELWANTDPDDLTFPRFTDNPESPALATQVFDAPGVNTTPLARGVPADSNLRGTPDWFVDVAFPVQMLVDNRVVGTAADLDGALFYPATATAPYKHNKDQLDCRFLPMASLAVDETVIPASVPSNATTHVTYTLVLHTGPVAARGVVVSQAALPAYFANVHVTADDPSAVVGDNPLQLRIDRIAANGTFTVRIEADATPGCTDPSTSSSATASATNGDQVVGPPAVLTVQPSSGPEVCDGLDNNCDGQVDEGGDALCDDGNPCNGVETCGGAAGCQPAQQPLDCDDRDPCTTDTCDPAVPGGCVNTRTPGCVACSTAANCDDGDPCTDDVCTPASTCAHSPRAACVRCTSPAQCDDGDPCTDDACAADGTCGHQARTGCIRCSTVADCDDRDPCTQDTCTGGTCAHNAIPNCCVPSPEVCGDGRDNDCDGLVDCADPDCAGAPECASEICGNCIDDDGNGLVDAEDPACCPAPMRLTVSRLTLRSTSARSRGNRLQLQTEYAPTAPPTFDPMKQDTTVQLSDAGGPLFCTTIGAEHWRRTRRFSFRFTDRARAFAGGLESGEFRVNRNGNLLFTAEGRGVELRDVQGDTVELTVRVGSECSQSTMGLRPARRGLVFP